MDKGERNARLVFACFIAIAVVVGIVADSVGAGVFALLIVSFIWGVTSVIKGPNKEEQAKLDAIKKQADNKAKTIDEIKSAASVFIADKNNTRFVAVYEDERLIKFSLYDKVAFDDIYSVELVVDNQVTIEKSGVGRAIIGSVIAGGTGAVVGAVTGKSKQYSQAQKIEVVLKLRNVSKPTLVFTYFDYGTTKGMRKEYVDQLRSTMLEFATRVTNTIDTILIQDSSNNNSNKSDGTTVDEIMKAKYLLDSGAITQSEFDAIKTKLLN